MTHTLLYNPSIDKLGNRRWYVNGQLHRLDGPAIEYRGVAKYWYVNGVQYTEEQFRLFVFVNSKVDV